ncbi:2OG-Fe(II) oxygenase [Aliikangiella sp. IMCC44359]|uniref:2OG-Fe(II) oxygenase n=1 Tax=Aliikangiella sp. IMCC44359 TaxID=3459125 RepID=UPI00403B0E55
MKFKDLSTDLQSWIHDSVVQGQSAEQIGSQLTNSGHHKSVVKVVEKYIQNFQKKATSTTQNAGSHHVEILMTLDKPKIVMFDNLLTHQECDQIIELSKTRLTPSTVINRVSGTYDQSNVRTSSGACFKRGENQLIKKIEKRISELVHCPVSQGEPIQTLNYAVGAEYKPHYDYFDPRDPGNQNVLAMGGQRYATIIMYLNNVKAGGSTVFPRLGLDILPRKGGALFFAYSNPSGFLDELTFHGGSPVQAGEKWIATKWLRLDDYTGPMA